jgi:hypothetical protein
MTITRNVYDTATLLGTLRQLAPVNTYWLDLCFPRTITFDDEYIDFSKIEDRRVIAPLVVPTAQGKPIYGEGEKLMRVKPAYIKPKDAVSAARMLPRAGGLGELLSATPMAPQQRYNAIIADILRVHANAIIRRWEWMAAEAIQKGTVTLEGDAYPKTLVDFERASGHTITLGNAARWGDAGVSIMDNVETWRKTVRDASFGGPTDRLTIGSDVWAVMRADEAILDKMKIDQRVYNNGLNLNLGIREGLDAEYVGTLSGTLQVWVYSDYYQDTNGANVPLMNSKDVVLTGPNVQGVKAFGAILDKAASMNAMAMFPKMWDEQDPSATYVMTQSAPLMVPVNPNNTLKARVLA